MRYLDWISHHGRIAPERLAFVTPRLRLTYGRLSQASVAIAHRLAGAGVKPGQTAGVGVVNPAFHAALLIALNMLGAAALSFGRGANGGLESVSGVAVDWLLSDDDTARPAGARVIRTDWAWLDESMAGPATFPSPNDRGDAAAMVSLSSGTTGAPKAIRYTARQVEDRLLSYGYNAFASRPGESTLCLFGVRTMIGFQIAMTTLLAGGTVLMGFMNKDIGTIIQQFGVSRLFASPTQLASVLEQLAQEPADCSSLKLVFVAGSATSPTLATRLTQRLCANLVTGYGASEAGLIAHAPLGRIAAVPGAAGYLVPWCSAEAVDDSDAALPPGQIGRLRFKTGQVVAGYENAPEATRAAFRDGWFYPGDLGAVTQDRLLVIVGRDDEVLNLGGVKLDPVLVADALLSHSAIADAAVFVAPNARGEDALWAALVVKGRPDVDALRQFCRQTLGTRAPTQFLFPPRLPRNENGKLMVAELRDMAARGLARLGMGEPRQP